MIKLKSLFLILCICSVFLTLNAKQDDTNIWLARAEAYLAEAKTGAFEYMPISVTKVDTAYLIQQVCVVNFTEHMAYHSLRSTDVSDIKEHLSFFLKLSSKQILEITVDDLPLEDYVPNYYLNNKDDKRLSEPYTGKMNVRNISKSYQIDAGLDQRHIALWNSHGLYYNHEKGRWTFQRAPVFTTVEDLFTSAYVLSFLTPMLENAGANVYLPRERDVQTHQVVIDDVDDDFHASGRIRKRLANGYSSTTELRSSDVNAFHNGVHTALKRNAEVEWVPIFPESGNYAVYVSYQGDQTSTKKAKYTVCHAGGKTEFEVNQQMASGTWVYLGNFDFENGAQHKVVLSGKSFGKVTADAVRFGGGKGSVFREDSLSGAPRWQEAARYHMQFSGVNDTLVFNRHGDTLDYNDDFRSRARWVNFLQGGQAIEPWLTNGEDVAGFNIPIDMSLGVHTDAGHFNALDSTVGTLGIYSTYDVKDSRDFYFGKSRLLNRDLCDLIQTSIVRDIRALYDDKWTQRELWDKMYSEATFATVPSMLLEIHAHSNPRDMYHGLNPQFRFDVSRSIYKAILHFLSTYYQEEYCVQPLPVVDFAINSKDNEWHLSWSPKHDVLEPTAVPSAYVVYHRVGALGWDNGTLVSSPNFQYEIQDTLVHSFKIAAVNSGGESFPSVTLAACQKDADAPTLMVIDGFTRVSAPAFIVNKDSVGVAPWIDEGVPYGLDIATIGEQYEYNQTIPWKSDDDPGHGGTDFSLLNDVFVGNSFDNAYTHVCAIANSAFNVVSSSLAAVENNTVDLSTYDGVDIFFGEQRTTPMLDGTTEFEIFTPSLIEIMNAYLENASARLIVSGAHIGNDVYADTTSQVAFERERFVSEKLGYSFSQQCSDSFNTLYDEDYSLLGYYNVSCNKKQYRVEHVDALLPEGEFSSVLMQYAEDDIAVIVNAPSYKVINAGFPFECVQTDSVRNTIMSMWLNVLFDK